MNNTTKKVAYIGIGIALYIVVSMIANYDAGRERLLQLGEKENR